MQPLVSILIPAYNAERWIADTIRSALNQTWLKKEIIIVDDGSTDRTLDIAKQFESKRVKVINQANSGGPAARNTAILHAQGEFIQWLDHDDLLAPDKIEYQMKRFEEDGDSRLLLSGVFGTFYYRISKARFVPNPLLKNMTPIDYFLIKFSNNAWLQPSVWLVSRKLTEMAGPWWEIRTPDDDGEYYCRVVAACEGIRFVPAAKSYWRVGNYGSMSKAKSSAALGAFFSSTVRCIRHFIAIEDSDRSRQACIRFLQSRLLRFLPERPDLVRLAQELARELGAEISLPSMKWRYDIVRRFFGIASAAKIRWMLPKIRESTYSTWDRIMYEKECLLRYFAE